MARKKSKMTQIMAFLALFGIVIGIIGTGVLVFFSNTTTEQTLSPEEYAELQEYINSLSGTTSTGSLEETTTLTGETN